MDPFHGGPQRYTVEVRSLLGEEPALEAAVDSGDERVFSVRAAAALGDCVAKYRFAPEFPGGVRAAKSDGASGEFSHGDELVAEQLLLGGEAASYGKRIYDPAFI